MTELLRQDTYYKQSTIFILPWVPLWNISLKKLLPNNIHYCLDGDLPSMKYVGDWALGIYKYITK